MKIAIAVASALFALVAIALGAAVPSARAQEGICYENPGPVDPADPSIIVDSPTAGATVTSPLTVTGQARTFESTVQVAVFDVDGTKIASTFGTAAAPDAGVHGPFSIPIEFSVAVPTDGCVWVYEQSAQTGDPINVVQVPVRLQPAQLPSTGLARPEREPIGTTAVLAALLAALGAGSLGGVALLRRR